MSISAISEVISLEGDMKMGFGQGNQIYPKFCLGPITFFLKSKEDRPAQEHQNMTLLAKTLALKSIIEFQ